MACDCSAAGDGSPAGGTGNADPTMNLLVPGITALPPRKRGAD